MILSICKHVIRHAARLVKRDFILRNISTQPLRQMLPINQVSNPELLLHSTSTVGSIVNAVLPTVIDTAVNRSAMPENSPADWVSPDDLASVICFLLYPAAKPCTVRCCLCGD